MADPQYDSNNEIKVEDLLRLKKAERPSDAFWSQFDRELHQRMLQTLVKKDPWYVQLARGLTGRIAQTTAVAGAAMLLALVTIRPALTSFVPANSLEVVEVDSIPNSTTALRQPAATTEVAMADFPRETSSRDYGIEMITAEGNQRDGAYKRDFAMDVLHRPTNESADYSGDSAGSWSTFGSTGVASLVY